MRFARRSKTEAYAAQDANRASTAPSIYDIRDTKQLAKAGPSELVALVPDRGRPPIVLPKRIPESIAGAIADAEMIHIHGHTGTAKTGFFEALAYVPENWKALCALRGIKYKPLRVFPVEMVVFDTISEMYYRRAIRDGQTYDEPSCIVNAILESKKVLDDVYPVIWLREIGRVSTAAIQGGLLNLMTQGFTRISDNAMVSGAGVAWFADSNYHTDATSTHILVTQDDALKRRWTVSIAFDFPSPEQEVEILRYLMKTKYLPATDEGLVLNIVELGGMLRTQRAQGNLLSLAPPTIYGYCAFIREAARDPHYPLPDVANLTLLGSANLEDREAAQALFCEVFGFRRETANSVAAGGDLV
jgi:hypothetical protein